MPTTAALARPPAFFSEQIQEARRFFLDLTPAPEAALAVVCGGCERCTPDFVIRRESFPYLVVEYVAAGAGTLRLDGKTYALSPGTVFTYGPGIAQEIHTDPERRLVKYFVDFAGRRGLTLMREAGILPGTVMQVPLPAGIQQAFDGLVRDALAGTRLAGRLCALQLERLLLKIAEGAMPYGAGDTRALATYQQCRRHIEEHFLALRGVGEVAAACRVNPAHLCRLFRRFGEESPRHFLTRLKMNRAAESLAAPGRLVKEAATELGFADPYHFSRVFKSVHGFAPERFIKLGGRR